MAKIVCVSVLVLVLVIVGFTFRGWKAPLWDPAPAGEGSFTEADTITKQFLNYYRTNEAKSLPQGYVRLQGIGEQDLDGTWIVYYATASHSKVRGGTMVIMDSSGRIDTYFGHHCSSADGGVVLVPGTTIFGGYYEGGVESVRQAFAKSFKHQKTEQAPRSDGDKPPN